MFENAGTLDLWSDGGTTGGAGSEFRNSGTLVKRGGTAPANVATGFYGSYFAVQSFINSGAINVQVGTMGLGYPGTSSRNTGSITAGAGTHLWLLGAWDSPGSIDADNVVFYAANATTTGSIRANRTEIDAPVAMSGTILDLGDVTVGSGGTLDLTDATFAAGAATFDSLSLLGRFGYVNDAFLVTDADLTVAGQFTSRAGTVRAVAGEGSLIGAGGADIVGLALLEGAEFLLPVGATAELRGGVWIPSGVWLAGGARFENAGTLELWDDYGVAGDAQSQFLNTGTLVKKDGSTAPNVVFGSLLTVAQFTNSGVIDVQVGTLSIGYAGKTAVNAGAITGAAGTTVGILNGHESTGTIDVDRVSFRVGSASIAGSFRANRTEIESTVAMSGTILDLGDVTVSHGTLDLTGATFAGSAATLDSLTLYRSHPSITAQLITNEDITVTGLFKWTGSLVGDGSLTANGGTEIGFMEAHLVGGFDYLNPVGQLVNWNSQSDQHIHVGMARCSRTPGPWSCGPTPAWMARALSSTRAPSANVAARLSRTCSLAV